MLQLHCYDEIQMTKDTDKGVTPTARPHQPLINYHQRFHTGTHTEACTERKSENYTENYGFIPTSRRHYFGELGDRRVRCGSGKEYPGEWSGVTGEAPKRPSGKETEPVQRKERGNRGGISRRLTRLASCEQCPPALSARRSTSPPARRPAPCGPPSSA
jgi:hypothetical protein